MYEKIKDFQIAILGFFVFLATISGAKIATDNLHRNGISVTGTAYEIVKSDSASWNIELSAREKNNAKCYNIIKNQLPIIKSYLIKKGMTPEQIDVSPANSFITYKLDPKTGYSTNEIAYYNYSQSIKVNSNNVELVKNLSNEIQELVNKGININSTPPEYQYSKISDLKIKLLEEATKDSKQRAKAMLKANNNRVGGIMSVKMGVFQITSPDSNSVSDEGINDSSTINKKVTAVANVFYGIK